MFEEFKREALPFLESAPDSDCEWLAVAQHHGMATRLLDWTRNPMAALWFVIKSARGSGDTVDTQNRFFDSCDDAY
jgi:hypothetical protein